MIDRLLLAALALGVWANVLTPVPTTAHGEHECDISGTGLGEIDGDEVYVYEITGYAYCP